MESLRVFKFPTLYFLKVFNKIVKIEDGLRNTISLSYDKAVSSGAPDVVKTVSVSTSLGKTSDVSYDYSGALYDSRNHSFMCYGTVKSTDAVSGRELSSQYRMQHRSAVPYKSMESAGGKGSTGAFHLPRTRSGSKTTSGSSTVQKRLRGA